VVRMLASIWSMFLFINDSIVIWLLEYRI